MSDILDERVSNPRRINEDAWYFETTTGFEFVVDVNQWQRDKGGTMQFTIPWSQLRGALKRKDKAFAKKQ